MTSFASALSAPALMPFTLAALVMTGLVLVEAVSLVIGHSASALIDGLLGHDGLQEGGVDEAQGHAVDVCGRGAEVSHLGKGLVCGMVARSAQ